MIVVSTTIARYPSRGHLLGYLWSCRFPMTFASPRFGIGALTAVVLIFDPLPRNSVRHPPDG